MQVTVMFRHMESSDALRKYAVEKSERLVKYLFEPIEIHWALSVEKIRHIADANYRQRRIYQGAGPGYVSAIDMALEKLEKQVRSTRKDQRPQASPTAARKVMPGRAAIRRRGPRIVKKKISLETHVVRRPCDGRSG